MTERKQLDWDHIAFIGRTFDEYMRIFHLDEKSLFLGHILDCPAGASSFTAEAVARGYEVTACDVLYDQSIEKLKDKSMKDITYIKDNLDETVNTYRWDYYGGKDGLMRRRKEALESFARDFEKGMPGGRYVHAELPYLPFQDKAFKLVLSSHFLFLYGDMLSIDFHVASIKEFVRVCCGEIRIYPLTGMDGSPYPYLAELLSSVNRYAELIKAPFEFLRGANQILRIRCADEERGCSS